MNQNPNEEIPVEFELRIDPPYEILGDTKK